MTGGPAPDEPPVDLAPLVSESPHVLVFDTVYTPLETPLIAAARDLGLGTIDGGEMFVSQAAAQFEAWTRTPAPVKLFDQLVRNNP
jgi:shikimate 5-dehydrogenase